MSTRVLVLALALTTFRWCRMTYQFRHLITAPPPRSRQEGLSLGWHAPCSSLLTGIRGYAAASHPVEFWDVLSEVGAISHDSSGKCCR
jgi:hypothetical protein